MNMTFVLKSGAVVTLTTNEATVAQMVRGVSEDRNLTDTLTGVCIKGSEVAVAAPASAIVVHLPGGATVSPVK